MYDIALLSCLIPRQQDTPTIIRDSVLGVFFFAVESSLAFPLCIGAHYSQEAFKVNLVFYLPTCFASQIKDDHFLDVEDYHPLAICCLRDLKASVDVL